MISFKTIHSRIFIILVLASTLLTLSISMYLWMDHKSRSYNTFDSITQTINTLLVSNIKGFIYNDDKENIQYVIDSIQSKYIHNILILDTKGHILASQKNNYTDTQIYKHYKQIRLSNIDTIKDEKNYIIFNTFELIGVPLGYLIVEGNIEHYLTELNQKFIDLIVLVLILLSLTTVISFYLSKTISKPLYNIITTLRNTSSNETLVFDNESEIEFQYLIKSITQKHNDLLELNIKLEERVHQKTLELQNLNATLEEKISHAINDTQKKRTTLPRTSSSSSNG